PSPNEHPPTRAYRITATAPPPDSVVRSPATNGGTLIGGVCVLPGANIGQPYEGFILTSSYSGGTFSITSGRLPPGLSMPTSYGASGTIVAGTPTKLGNFIDVFALISGRHGRVPRFSGPGSSGWRA